MYASWSLLLTCLCWSNASCTMLVFHRDSRDSYLSLLEKCLILRTNSPRWWGLTRHTCSRWWQLVLIEGGATAPGSLTLQTTLPTKRQPCCDRSAESSVFSSSTYLILQVFIALRLCNCLAFPGPREHLLLCNIFCITFDKDKKKLKNNACKHFSVSDVSSF
jgi:hypothetical protein